MRVMQFSVNRLYIMMDCRFACTLPAIMRSTDTRLTITTGRVVSSVVQNMSVLKTAYVSKEMSMSCSIAYYSIVIEFQHRM